MYLHTKGRQKFKFFEKKLDFKRLFFLKNYSSEDQTGDLSVTTPLVQRTRLGKSWYYKQRIKL